MELTAKSRDAKKKSEAKTLRREGRIPAILYSNGEVGENISICDAEFQKILRSISKGTLSSKVITLKQEGRDVKVIVKGIQYHPTTYKVLHLDFQQLHDDVEVNIKIPLVCTGVVDCAGIKLGGILRQVIFAVLVKVKPKDIPDQFNVDVRDMVMGQSKLLKDVPMGDRVRSLMGLEEVAVVIAKR